MSFCVAGTALGDIQCIWGPVKTFSGDRCNIVHFYVASQAQPFRDAQVQFSWQAPRFRRVVLHDVFKAPWNCFCVKRWQSTNVVTGPVHCEGVFFVAGAVFGEATSCIACHASCPAQYLAHWRSCARRDVVSSSVQPALSTTFQSSAFFLSLPHSTFPFSCFSLRALHVAL